jgi:hypothetical protein
LEEILNSREGSEIAIRVLTSLPGQGSVSSSTGFVSYVDRADIPRGKYDVYFEHFEDKKYLGVIEIQ